MSEYKPPQSSSSSFLASQVKSQPDHIRASTATCYKRGGDGPLSYTKRAAAATA